MDKNMQVGINWTEQSMTIIDPRDLEIYTVPNTHPFFKRIKHYAQKNDIERSLSFLRKKDIIESIQDNRVEVVDGELFYRGEKTNKSLSRFIEDAIINDNDISPVLNFIDRVKKNPSIESEKQFYKFFSKHGFQITQEGKFRAYKYVTDDFKDCYTQTICNKPNTRVWMKRSEVEADPNIVCAAGLHACGLEYLGAVNRSSYKIIMVDICPSDVVSIPKDYNHSKIRCCEYYVVGEFTKDYDGKKLKPIEKKKPVSENKKHTLRGPDGRYISRENRLKLDLAEDSLSTEFYEDD